MIAAVDVTDAIATHWNRQIFHDYEYIDSTSVAFLVDLMLTVTIELQLNHTTAGLVR